MFAAPSYHCALILSITMPKFSRLAKTTRQDIWGRREGGYRRQRGFHGNFASCVQTRRNTSRTRITQYLIRFEDKIHISRYTEQTTNLTHTKACSCVAHQLLHHQLKQSIQSHYMRLQFVHVPFHH
jgi:hypothetical protein